MSASGLGAQMLQEKIVLGKEEIRQCIRDVINSAIEASPCHGGIYLDNITCTTLSGSIKRDFMVGKSENVLPLWTKWLADGSSNAAYIPPEGLEALPTSAGSTDKADSWAIGCLLVHLLDYGKPLTLKRRKTQDLFTEVFKLGVIKNKPNFFKNLQMFYAEAGKQVGLAVGPEFTVMDTIPYACKEFLAHSLEPDPEQRWNLQQLSQLRFVNTNISLEKLANKECEYYETRPVEHVLKVDIKGPHPFLMWSTKLEIKLGEMTALDNNNEIYKTTVEMWKFLLTNEQNDSELYSKAYGKLINLTSIEASTEERVKQRAGFYGIRALQKGAMNVMHHYGCQFLPAPNCMSVPEFHVYTEHCMGGNFEQAAAHYIAVPVLTKWIGSVLRGLEFLHSCGIVHRNLNSTIIFFTEQYFKGTIKIGGFHNMRQLNSDRTVKHEISARRGDDGRFVAPEISESYKKGVNIGRKCDIWSLGCVLLHLVTGQPPLYRGRTDRPMTPIDSEMAVIYYLNHHKKGPEIPDWVPVAVRAFMDKCLQFEPDERPSAADLLKERLDAPAGDGTIVFDYRSNRAAKNDLPQDVVSCWTESNTMVS